MAIELWAVQFWSDIILVISNETRTARFFDFAITRTIAKLHSTQFNYQIINSQAKIKIVHSKSIYQLEIQTKRSKNS